MINKMAVMDLSGFEYYLPLLSFLIVFLISFITLSKSKVVENKFLTVFFSFLISIVFVMALGPRNYILAIVPWFGVLIVGLFLVMVLMGFVGKDLAGMNKTVGMVFLVLLGLAFIISAFFVFSHYFAPYLPGNLGSGGNRDANRFLDWLYSPRIAGAVLLLAISAAVSWVLIKAK